MIATPPIISWRNTQIPRPGLISLRQSFRSHIRLVQEKPKGSSRPHCPPFCFCLVEPQQATQNTSKNATCDPICSWQPGLPPGDGGELAHPLYCPPHFNFSFSPHVPYTFLQSPQRALPSMVFNVSWIHSLPLLHCQCFNRLYHLLITDFPSMWLLTKLMISFPIVFSFH